MNKKGIALFYLLSFTWGILWTLVGLLVLAFVYIFMREQVHIFPVSGRICILFKEKKFGGISLGIVYMVDANNKTTTHTHEIGHTVQNMFMGPLFIPLVAIPSGIRYQLWGRIRERFYEKHSYYPSYYDIWFESQANRLGMAYTGDVLEAQLRL